MAPTKRTADPDRSPEPAQHPARANDTAGTRAPDPSHEAPSDPDHDAPSVPNPRTQYRAAELAERAGITPRTLRFYRERKLIPPPRREGRIAWYDERHLARLHTINALLTRGHTLGGIADLLTAFESGRVGSGTAELMGLESMLGTSFSEEEPVRLTPEALADHFQGAVTPENLANSLDIGYVTVDGEEIVHISRRLLESSAALVQEGIPLSAVLAAGRQLRTHTDAIAEVFSELLRRHILADDLVDGRASEITETLERLRPLAKQIVEAELGLALDRRVRSELDGWIRPAGQASASDDPDRTEAPGG